MTKLEHLQANGKVILEKGLSFEAVANNLQFSPLPTKTALTPPIFELHL